MTNVKLIEAIYIGLGYASLLVVYKLLKKWYGERVAERSLLLTPITICFWWLVVPSLVMGHRNRIKNKKSK